MRRKHFPESNPLKLPTIGQIRVNSPFVLFPGPPTNDRLFMNNLSGEGLFDERPMTQTSLGRFVLRAANDHRQFGAAAFIQKTRKRLAGSL